MPRFIGLFENYGRQVAEYTGAIPGASTGTLAVRGFGRYRAGLGSGYRGRALEMGTFRVLEVAVSAVLTGSATEDVGEADIVTGSETIIITLTDGTWVASGTAFNAQRQAIIDGLNSDGDEATGWNAEVRDEMAVTTVARTSATQVTITLPASASYQITRPETITVTVPATAIAQPTKPVVAGSFVVTPDAITAALSGDLADDVTDAELVSGGEDVVITLTNGTFIDEGFPAVRQAIIDGFVSGEEDANGWNDERANIPVTAVARTGDDEVTMTLPALGNYVVPSGGETVTVTVPSAAIAEPTEDVAAGTFDIAAAG